MATAGLIRNEKQVVEELGTDEDIEQLRHKNKIKTIIQRLKLTIKQNKLKEEI